MTYSDDTLRRFLDGVLPDDQRERIEQDLSKDQDLERRMMALDPVAPMVADSFGSLPDNERLQSLQNAIEAPAGKTSKARVWPVALGIAASFALGIVVSSQFFAPQENWRTAVADYQVLYTPDTVAPLDPDAQTLSASLDRAGEAVSLPIIETLGEDLDDFSLRRVQVLGFKGRPLIQMVFVGSSGIPIALCLMQGADNTKGPAELDGLASYSWGDGSHQFLLIGDIEQDRISDFAQRLMGRVTTAS